MDIAKTLITIRQGLCSIYRSPQWLMTTALDFEDRFLNPCYLEILKRTISHASQRIDSLAELPP